MKLEEKHFLCTVYVFAFLVCVFVGKRKHFSREAIFAHPQFVRDVGMKTKF